MSEWMTVSEVAKWLRCTANTVRYHLKSGRIPGYKVGLRLWRMDKQEVREALGRWKHWR
jgi:excisionase family DNA binding protein